MEFDPQDQDVVKLLTKLKGVGGNYPEHLLTARRQSYLAQMAEIGLGAAATKASPNAAKNGGTTNPAPAASTVLETALVVAMIAEASAVAYFYRDRFSNLFETKTTSPRVQEVTSPPAVTTSLEIQGLTASPAVTVTLPSVTISASPSTIAPTLSSTPIPGVAESTESNTNNAGTNQIKSTPAPNTSNGNQGNHYGQTPKPARTKDPGNNQGSGSGQTINEQSKPTKTK